MFLHCIQLLLIASSTSVQSLLANDTLGWEDGYTALSTTNFDIQLVTDSQTLASLKPKGSTFDFSPLDFLELRSSNGQYHIGDITFRYRLSGETTWTSGDTSTSREPVAALATDGLAAAVLKNTLPAGPLNITREWTNVDGDLGLLFILTNTGKTSMEIGSLGFPLEFNSIFTGRTAEDIQAKCSLQDPYIGLDAGYVQVTPISGVGPALIITPIGNTPFQAWRNLDEPYFDDTAYGSQVFEGLYEWQTLSLAYAENEWSEVEPWNEATSDVLEAGESVTFGLRFSLVADGIRGIQEVAEETGTPFAVGVPGFINPSDLTAQLYLTSTPNITSITTTPANALVFTALTSRSYSVAASPTTWGRVRVSITFSDNRVQTVHYYITKSGPQVLADLGNFATTTAWYTNTSDPFHRAPSPLTYDRSVNAPVVQEPRVWIAGLSDEGGAGMYIAATMKQAALPNAVEIAKLELFIDSVLSTQIQNADFSVKKSIFYYGLAGYPYNSTFDWTSWTSWDETDAFATDRAYDYVHPVAAYWAIYRAGRAYPDLLSVHTWDWYLNQAYQTVLSLMRPDQYGNCCEVGYALDGLMEETVIGELLKDLGREGWTVQAANVKGNMSVRAAYWETLAVPYGSEMAWDSTGQEGVYLWANYFGYADTVNKTIDSILGYTPTLAHWGWNGNARRYWDNLYGGKLQRIERQIHHYGSALNSQPLLSSFRTTPTDTHLLRTGYAGTSAPLSNIDQAGFPSASFHSWPNTLAWDAYSGDYGPGFVGLVLGAGTYVVEDSSLGLLAYGGELSSSSTSSFSVTPKDAVRRRIFIGPLGLFAEIDAGVIQDFTFDLGTGEVVLMLGQLAGAPVAAAAVLWVESTGGTTYGVVTSGFVEERGGWAVPFSGDSVAVRLSPS